MQNHPACFAEFKKINEISYLHFDDAGALCIQYRLIKLGFYIILIYLYML